MEVLSLDLYLDVQIGVTFSQNAGDYNLELAEYQVSPRTSFCTNIPNISIESFRRVRCATTLGGKVAFVSKLSQQVTFIIDHLFRCNCHSCVPGFYVDLFPQWDILIPKQTQQVHAFTMHSRPHLKSNKRWLIVSIYN